MNQINRQNWTLDKVMSFDDIIDVRSPAEYAEDHIPGAINLPVLDDAQRHEIGAIYARKSKHEAKRLGAAMVAINIAEHLRDALRDKPPQWSPLIYCWRGGNRSAAMTHVLRRIGWKAESLTGGYKTYRRFVLEELTQRPAQLRFNVLCGKTGVGKSVLLRKMASHNAQTLDLETLANHRGSVLGEPLGDKQPSQKTFESLLCHHLRNQNPARVIYVEAESQRIGRLRVPDTLIQAIRSAECWNIEADVTARAAFLAREYQHFIQNAESLKTALDRLTPYVGHVTINHWLGLYDQGKIIAFVSALLSEYYDPIYLKSMRKNYQCFDVAKPVRLGELSDDALTAGADTIRQCSPY